MFARGVGSRLKERRHAKASRFQILGESWRKPPEAPVSNEASEMTPIWSQISTRAAGGPRL